jgi:RNA polymerase sigma factor (sigma-70 family)
MTVVLWDINVSKRQQNPMSQQCPNDWTLNDYYTIAQRCIGAFASSSLANNMLHNEDAVSFVAEHLMYAAYRWDEKRGRTLYSYMNQCACWSIKRWINLYKKSNCGAIISLNDTLTDQHKPLYAITPIDVDAPDKNLDDTESQQALATLFNKAKLTDKQHYCVEHIYIHGIKPSEVARRLGVTRQAVHQCLRKGISKLKLVINEN